MWDNFTVPTRITKKDWPDNLKCAQYKIQNCCFILFFGGSTVFFYLVVERLYQYNEDDFFISVLIVIKLFFENDCAFLAEKSNGEIMRMKQFSSQKDDIFDQIKVSRVPM